jgi:hypothetical protein
VTLWYTDRDTSSRGARERRSYNKQARDEKYVSETARKITRDKWLGIILKCTLRSKGIKE